MNHDLWFPLQEDPSQAFALHIVVLLLPLLDVEPLLLLLLPVPLVQETAACWRSTRLFWSSCWTWRSATALSLCGVSSLGPPCLCCTAKVWRYEGSFTMKFSVNNNSSSSSCSRLKTIQIIHLTKTKTRNKLHSFKSCHSQGVDTKNEVSKISKYLSSEYLFY